MRFVVNAEAAETQKIQADYRIHLRGERLKIFQVANHHREIGNMDGAEINLGNFHPLGVNRFIKTENFSGLAARTGNAVRQSAVDHAVRYARVQDKLKLAVVPYLALQHNQEASVELEGKLAPNGGQVGLSPKIGRPTCVKDGK